MKSLLVFSALLLSASPAVAQFDRENNCIRNKESEIQRYEKQYQMAYQEVLKPENTVSMARQMEEAGRISRDLSQAEKNGIAYKFMTDELTRIKRDIKAFKTYPDCSELQGGIGQ
tara:strand:- start:440 stop:784 length:345 start_codon:yes stop_codon:yes gene_type:complete